MVVCMCSIWYMVVCMVYDCVFVKYGIFLCVCVVLCMIFCSCKMVYVVCMCPYAALFNFDLLVITTQTALHLLNQGS